MISMEILNVLNKMTKLMYQLLPKDRTGETRNVLGDIPKSLCDLFLDIQEAKERLMTHEKHFGG